MIVQMTLLKPFKIRNKLVFLKRDYLKGLGIFLTTFLFFGFLVDHVQLLRNTTHSLPYKFFLYFPKMTPHKGDMTVYQMNGKNLIKQIIGVGGDQMIYDKNKNLYVGDFNVGPLQTHDSHGQKLFAIEEGRIYDGFVFLYAPHPKSFDSRYESMGLVDENALKGKAIPLF